MKSLKMLLSLTTAVLLFGFIFMGNTWACDDYGWVSPDANEKAISIPDAIKKLQRWHKVKVSDAQTTTFCTNDLAPKATNVYSNGQTTTTGSAVSSFGMVTYAQYNVETKQNELLATVPVPTENKNTMGNYLKARVEQLLKTPTSTLLKIKAAGDLFRKEAGEVKEQYGINFYIPNQLSLKERYKDSKELVYATTEYYADLSAEPLPGLLMYSSGEFLTPDSIYIKLIEYVPVRETYSDLELYTTGDLVALIKTGGSLRTILETRIKNNIDYCCSFNNNSNPEIKTRWQTYQTNLAKI